MQEKLKNTKGITLVALIITIIILLILAGVTISLVIGDNGLITKSKQGVGEYQTRAEEEKAQLDEFEQGINENSEDSKVMKMLVNSGEDKVFTLTILESSNYNFEIDWGDENEEIIKKENIEEGKLNNVVKIASKNNIKIGDTVTKEIKHTYSNSNKEYEIKIKGNLGGMYFYDTYSSSEKILEIRQWGEVGIKQIRLNCKNMKKIAIPTEKSFEELIWINFAECESLTSIPENLFANCPNVKYFDLVFAECTSLTSIPEKLFANCPNVTDFSRTFYGCKNLTGNSIKLWSETERKEKGIDENNGGTNCYYGCTKLTDYNEIPRVWKESDE